MAGAASYDGTLRHGAQTPFSDQLTFQWEGGMWDYDAYHDSMATAARNHQRRLPHFYNQGTKMYELDQTL
jgi:hypothetical protein